MSGSLQEYRCQSYQSHSHGLSESVRSLFPPSVTGHLIVTDTVVYIIAAND